MSLDTRARRARTPTTPLDYWIKLDKDVSIIGILPYAVFIAPLIVLSPIALRTQNLLFHRAFAACSLLALPTTSVTTLAPLGT